MQAVLVFLPVLPSLLPISARFPHHMMLRTYLSLDTPDLLPPLRLSDLPLMSGNDLRTGGDNVEAFFQDGNEVSHSSRAISSLLRAFCQILKPVDWAETPSRIGATSLATLMPASTTSPKARPSVSD